MLSHLKELTEHTGDYMALDSFTVAQVASRLGVSKAAVHNWIDAKRFPNCEQIDRDKQTSAILIPKADFEKVRKEEIEKLKKALRKSKTRLTLLQQA